MIKIENLTKSYRTPTGRHYLFKNLNLEIPAGKNTALIGRNGAGKSSLLRIIGGIDRPDNGRIITHKKISWPVGLSGGFQGSLTGRENIKFITRIYSEKQKIQDKIKFVEVFSELGNYFDMPVKSYSSGMKSRLSFGLSMAFDFDYYLIDEVISVGDDNFKKKCIDILKLRNSQSDFLMVSHSINHLITHCQQAILFDGNENVRFYENITEAVELYKSSKNRPQVKISNHKYKV